MKTLGYSKKKLVSILGLLLAAGLFSNCELFHIRASHPAGPPPGASSSRGASSHAGAPRSGGSFRRAGGAVNPVKCYFRLDRARRIVWRAERGSSPTRVAANLTARLQKARRYLAEGVACMRAVPVHRQRGRMSGGYTYDLPDSLRRARARIALREADLARLQPQATLAREGDEILRRIKSSSLPLVALRRDVTAYETKVKTAHSTVPRALAWRIRQMATGLERRVKRLKHDRARAEYNGLLANTVTARFPELKQDDVYDLTKVRAAFAKADKKMFVSVVRRSGMYWDHKYKPVPRHKPEYGGFYIAYKKGKPQWKITWARGLPRVMVVRYKTLKPGTVGLLWSSNKRGYATFVTVDGARYRSTIRKLNRSKGRYELSFKAGLPPVSQWAPAFQHVPLVPTDVKALAGRGLLKAGRMSKLEVARKKGSKCYSRVWKRAGGRFRALERANITWSSRRYRIQHLRDRTESRARRSCKRHVRRMARLMRSAIKERTSQRKALYKAVVQLAGQK